MLTFVMKRQVKQTSAHIEINEWKTGTRAHMEKDSRGGFVGRRRFEQAFVSKKASLDGGQIKWILTSHSCQVDHTLRRKEHRSRKYKMCC